MLISDAVAAETTMPLVPLAEHMLRGVAAPCAGAKMGAGPSGGHAG